MRPVGVTGSHLFFVLGSIEFTRAVVEDAARHLFVHERVNVFLERAHDRGDKLEALTLGTAPYGGSSTRGKRVRMLSSMLVFFTYGGYGG